MGKIKGRKLHNRFFRDFARHLLDPYANNSNLNEVAPAVTGATSYNSLYLTITLFQSVFSWLSISAQTNRHFLLLAAPTGFEPAISALTGPHVSRYTTGPFVCSAANSLPFAV